MVAVIGLAFGVFAQDASFDVRLDAAIASGSQSNVLALLDVFGGNNSEVYRAAVNMLPKEQRLAFIQSLPAFVGKELLTIPLMPKGAERNAALVSFYSVKNGNARLAHLFDEGSATKAECSAYYALVLKNVEANSKTVSALGTVKGQILKLQDIE